MRTCSHHDMSIEDFASIVGGVRSSRSHAVMIAAAVGIVILAIVGATVKDSTDDGTRVDIAIHVAAIASLTDFSNLLKRSLVFWEIDFLGHFCRLIWLFLFFFMNQ